MDTSQITEEDYLRMTPEQQEQYMIRQQQLMAQPSKPIHAPPSTYSDQDGYSPSPGATIDGKLDAASAKAAVQRLAAQTNAFTASTMTGANVLASSEVARHAAQEAAAITATQMDTWLQMQRKARKERMESLDEQTQKRREQEKAQQEDFYRGENHKTEIQSAVLKEGEQKFQNEMASMDANLVARREIEALRVEQKCGEQNVRVLSEMRNFRKIFVYS